MDLSQIVNGIASVFNLAAAGGTTKTPAGADLLTQIPGAATAVNYIRRQLVTLQRTPARLTALEAGNKALQAIASKKDPTAVAKLQRLLANLAPIRFQYQDVAGSLAQVMLSLNASGFAAPVPLELAGQVIKAAAGVAALFGNVEEAEKQLAAVARGLGVEVPAGVPAGVDLGQVAKWGAVAAGGFLALRALTNQKRRR